MNLIESLEQSAARWPDKTALIEGEEIISYAALQQRECFRALW